MKQCYRFFGGFLSAQERWLNRMAEKGYRLVHVGRLGYGFEPCPAKQVQYCVEFIGQKSRQDAAEYHDFLEEMGYRVFYKNLNLNYSIGKVRWRPWAEQGGQIATPFTTYNRELLIVEKENDGKPFALHTTYEDRAAYYRVLRRPYLCLFLLSALLGVVTKAWAWGIFAAACLVPLAFYQLGLRRQRKAAQWEEW